MAGCLLSDLGVNILRNMMVICVENLLNTDVCLSLQILDFFRYFGGPRDGLGPHFGGFLDAWGRIYVVREGAGNLV